MISPPQSRGLLNHMKVERGNGPKESHRLLSGHWDYHIGHLCIISLAPSYSSADRSAHSEGELFIARRSERHSL